MNLPTEHDPEVTQLLEQAQLVKFGYIRQSQLIPFIVPISSATLWRWVKSGKFVQPYKLGANITAWRTEEVRAWLKSRTVEITPHA